MHLRELRTWWSHFYLHYFAFTGQLFFTQKINNLKIIRKLNPVVSLDVTPRDDWVDSRGGNEESSVKQHSVHVQPTGIQLHTLLKPRHHKPHETDHQNKKKIPNKTHTGAFFVRLGKTKKHIRREPA